MARKTEEELKQEAQQKMLARTLSAVTWGELLECFKTLNENMAAVFTKMEEIEKLFTELTPALVAIRTAPQADPTVILPKIEEIVQKYAKDGTAPPDPQTALLVEIGRAECEKQARIAAVVNNGAKPQ